MDSSPPVSALFSSTISLFTILLQFSSLHSHTQRVTMPHWRSCSTAKRRPHPDVLLFRLRHMVGFEKVELDNSVDQEQARSQHPPQGDVPRQGLRDGRPPKLDADEKLCDDDGDHHPALATQFVALGVVQELKGLPQGNSSPKQNKKEADWVEDVVRRHPQSKLQVERVELSDEESGDQADDGKPPFKAGEGIPLELNPPMRGELAEETLDLAPVSGNLVKTPPVVGFQSQPPEGVDAKDCPSSIADEHVQDPMVPP